jgi:hypothetical protein
MEPTPHDRRRRQEAAYRRLGTRTPRCQFCRETDPHALTGQAPAITCYEHTAEQTGKHGTELHHPSGQHNDPYRIALPGNDHRVLSDLQKDWPLETLRNPHGSPLLKASAALRGWLDVLLLLIERVIGWIAPFLEQLDAELCRVLGEEWWIDFGFDDEWT